MTKWAHRVLKEFPKDLARFWIVADPDDVLLDERLLSALRDRGFSVLPFEDSITFRAEYEERYRAAWDRGEPGPSPALILHLRRTDVNELPWDYRRQARPACLSLSNLFPKLNTSVIRQLDSEMLPLLYEAQEKHAHHTLGEAATKDFVLTHIFRMSPHFITRHEDLWRELLRLHYREWALPPVLAHYVGQIVRENEAFQKVQVTEFFADRSLILRTVREAWSLYLVKQGFAGSLISEPASEYVREVEIPFEHPDVRGIIDSMFLDGTLPPVTIDRVPASLPKWASNGVVKDPASRRNLVLAGIEALSRELPTFESLHRDWTHFAQRLAEVMARFHRLDLTDMSSVGKEMVELRENTDRRLAEWVKRHYSDLSTLPSAKGPVIVHQVPHFLAFRRDAGEEKIALLVLDGMSIDQWIQVRENVAKTSRQLVFEENACFAWLPTLTSVSRQALFSGLRPREFADSIDTTAKDSGLWQRFWQGQGLRSPEIFFRKSIKRVEDLPDLEVQLSGSPVKVAGIVVDTIDDFVHGAVLGKRDIASRIATWCESKVMDRLFEILLAQGFHVYLTSDHGNVEAIGVGRPNQGSAPEMRAERVRTYRSENLISESEGSIDQTFRLEIPGLPPDFKPLFASGYGAFIPKGEHLVAHGGISVEELLVPFIKVKYSSKTQ